MRSLGRRQGCEAQRSGKAPCQEIQRIRKFSSSRNLQTLPTTCGPAEAAGLQPSRRRHGRRREPDWIAWRFSPESNKKRDVVKPEHELRVLIATDVLSEGQNLQDCHVIVNYDLPWAIIRLIQRAGRVDRIGQKSDTIYCYSFMPADGVERIIHLRRRVRQRLKENAEVVGSDEVFLRG